MAKPLKIRELLGPTAEELQLKLLAGDGGLDKVIQTSKVQKPGLALAGFTEFVQKHRVQLFGSTELGYLATLSADKQREALQGLFARDLACVVCTKGITPPDTLKHIAEAQNTALLTTPHLTDPFINRVQAWIDDRLAPQTNLHGVLVEIFGIGVLIIGKSGIGKSECALELVQRGHRFITDDVVIIKRHGLDTVYGYGHHLAKHSIEIRGLGIVNLRDMFGIVAVRSNKQINLVAELVAWADNEEYDRLGIDDRFLTVLDVKLPLVTIPVKPGRNTAAIVELAARNQILKLMGSHSAVELYDRLRHEMKAMSK